MKRLQIFRTKKQKGQGMVEFALALPVFLLAVFGVIELSRFFLIYSSVYTASREAARYGASVGVAADGVTPHDHDCAGIQQVAFTQGRFAGITNVTVQIQNLNEDLTVLQTVPCGNQTRMGDRVLVQVDTTFQPILGVIPSMPVTASADRTIMKDIDLRGTPPPTLQPATPFPSATANINPTVLILDTDDPVDDLLILRDYTSGVKALDADVLLFHPNTRIHTWTLESGTAANVSILSPHSEDTNVNFSSFGLYTFKLEVFDGQYTGSDTIQVFVNAKPEPNAGGPYSLVGTNGNVCSTGLPFRLSGSVIDPYGFTVSPPLTSWNNSGPGSVVYTPSRLNTLNPTVTFSSSGTYSFALTADDGYITATSAPVNVPVNFPPLVIAAVDNSIPLPTTTPPYKATLTGSATNPDGLPAPGTISNYLWEKVSGPGTVSFANAATPNTTATFSARGDYVLRLKAYDGCEYGYSPNITIHVNKIPVVNANVPSGQPVMIIPANVLTATITGSVTDDGYPNDPVRLTYAWSGPDNVTIANPTSLSTTINFSSLSTAMPGSRIMRLTASDGWESAFADVAIVNNSPPVANAGVDQEIASTASATLNGTATDINLPYQTLTYLWERATGTGTGTGQVTISNPSSQNTTVSFSQPGVYVLRLTVSDGMSTHSDDITITKNVAPVAIATPLNSIIPAGGFVALDGKTSYDLDNFKNPITYLWTKKTGPSAPVVFTGSGNERDDDPNATFNTPGNYVIQLEVNDGIESAYATVVVRVNAPPTTNAGPDQLILSTANSAMLNGTASDDGIGNPMSTLTYTWSKVSGPGTVSFSSSSILNPTATFSAVGTYELRLTVNDGWASSSDTVIIRNNLVPIANAGSPQSTKKSRDYILVGAIGYDPDNLPGPLTITWSGTGIKSGGSTLSPTVYFDNTGTYTLTLTVNDGLELRTSQVVITVTP